MSDNEHVADNCKTCMKETVHRTWTPEAKEDENREEVTFDIWDCPCTPSHGYWVKKQGSQYPPKWKTKRS